MAVATFDPSTTQMPMPGMPMPGMPTPTISRRPLTSHSLCTGQEVQYHGRIRGGPRQGVRGTVIRTGLRQAIVDLGSSGRWSIPYYFLTVLEPPRHRDPS